MMKKCGLNIANEEPMKMNGKEVVALVSMKSLQSKNQIFTSSCVSSDALHVVCFALCK
jgi:hypothetical protein